MESILSVLNVVFFNIIVPIFILSFMIFIHELGHYLSARWIKAEIKEFAVGMGPKLLSHKSKKTNILYAIRAVPIGGALTLVGEDENSDSENAFFRKPVWKRFLMIVSGSIMNLLLGFIIMAVMVVSSAPNGYASTRISRFEATATSNASGLMEGDQILKINNKKINVYIDLAYALIREGKDPVNVTVLRNGKKEVIYDVQFPVDTEGGITTGMIDFRLEADKKTVNTVIKQTFYQSIAMVDLVWSSFFDLITGKVGVDELSGPVGVTQAIGNSAREVTEGGTRPGTFLLLLAIITINLGIVNLLPLPALDGGRIVFLLIEFVRRKPLKPEYEGYVHLAGFALMIIFLLVVTYKDIMNLIVR